MTLRRRDHWRTLLVVTLGALAGAMLLRQVDGPPLLVNRPLHAVFESVSGMACIALAVLLFVLGRARDGFQSHLPASCGLLALGLLDVLHAALGEGNAFVWTRSASTLLGGAGFALLWVPQPLLRRASKALMPGFAAAAVVGGVVCALLNGTPAFDTDGRFASVPVALNLVGAGLFAAALVRLSLARDALGSMDRSFLAAFCLLQCLAHLLLPDTRMWQLDWWWWHVLRGLAALVLLQYAFRLLLRLQDRLRHAVSARDEFVSVAAHELRTPIALLTLQTDRLERLLARDARHDPSVWDKLVPLNDSMARQSRRLRRLVTGLLDVRQLEGGALDLHRERVDLGDLVGNALELTREELARAGCVLETSLESDVPGDWDPARVEQVVVNLVTNARKFGEGRPIHVEVERRESCALLRVRDHGIGISSEDQAHIFERYSRADEARVFGGLGLGLYISRQIVAAHGGTMRVESVPGQGATFTVELPLVAVDAIEEERIALAANAKR